MNVTINGKRCAARQGETLLAVAEREGIKIPTLCALKDLSPTGACRVCVVEAEGQRNLVPACAYPASEGLEVRTNSPRVRRARKTIIELLIANHPQDCLVCERNQTCELQHLAREYDVRMRRYHGKRRRGKIDVASPAIERDVEKCILCGRCVRVCHEVQNVGAIDFANRGFRSVVAPAMERSLNTVACVECGQCVLVCPVGALGEKSSGKPVWEAINSPARTVVAQVAPAVRAALGEEFGLPAGTLVTGKIVAALRRLGVDRVFDTNFSADLTIMEEGHELLERVKNGGTLPLLTSCSPGWVAYIEHFYPDLLPHLSSCKSPHEMQGALLKSAYAERIGLDPSSVFVLSIMPCTAKKFEAQRPELGAQGPDVDAVLTTRELARMIRAAGIDFARLPDEPFDDPMGDATGAAALFGASGGVMEAAVRTVYHVLTGGEMSSLEFSPIRGADSTRRAEVTIGDRTLRLAAVSGLRAVGPILDAIRAGESPYDFIEVMACPGGCVNGGGQPRSADPARVRKRTESMYALDRDTPVRCSHHNQSIQHLYNTFLEAPGSHLAHKLLHTEYIDRSSGTRS
ncbi:MAG: iron hydrogenase small subunit [Ignavibacteriae bacterium]|nr:iron hydrogenase small subunit [Ignavibacteriota bacterium]